MTFITKISSVSQKYLAKTIFTVVRLDLISKTLLYITNKFCCCLDLFSLIHTHTNVLPTYVYVHTCVPGSHRGLEDCVRSPGTEVMGGCEPPCGAGTPPRVLCKNNMCSWSLSPLSSRTDNCFLISLGMHDFMARQHDIARCWKIKMLPRPNLRWHRGRSHLQRLHWLTWFRTIINVKKSESHPQLVLKLTWSIYSSK